MGNAQGKVEIRPMILGDIDAMFSIDKKIRAAEKAITYANLTTEHIFTIDRKASLLRRPTSYVDLITGDVAGLLDYGFVAEVDGHVRGFVLGRLVHIGEAAAEEGQIVIVGVHPDYQREGVASKLVSALLEKYRSKGIKTVRVAIDERDKDLLEFAKHMGFSVGRLIEYSKTL